MNVKIPFEKGILQGILQIPEDPIGLVLFSHGSGSSRLSKRNQYVATMFNEDQIATLLFDLLTEEEEKKDTKDMSLRFDIDLLTKRLLIATEWCAKQKKTHPLLMGYFGASTGAAAAINAAALTKQEITAVVSRGGRPDLSKEYLKRLNSPTLLIVGGDDAPVIDMNKEAYDLISCEKRMEIIEGATHLFEESGKLEQVAQIAKKWFFDHFTKM